MVRDRLDCHQQQVFDLYYGERLSQVAIAARLNVTQPAVSMRLKTIRRRFEIAGVELPPAPFVVAPRDLLRSVARRVPVFSLLATDPV